MCARTTSWYRGENPENAQRKKEIRNVLFNDALNTFNLRLYTVKYHLDSERGNSLLLLYGPLFRLAARVLLYAPPHRHDSTYHDICYTSRGTLAGTRNSSIGPPRGIDLTTISLQKVVPTSKVLYGYVRCNDLKHSPLSRVYRAFIF